MVKGFILQMGQEDVVPLVKNIETTVPTVVNMRCTVDAVDFEAADWEAASEFTQIRAEQAQDARDLTRHGGVGPQLSK